MFCLFSGAIFVDRNNAILFYFYTITTYKKWINKLLLQSKWLCFIYSFMYRLIGLVGTVFANGLRNLGSILGCIIPKTLKMVLDTSLFNTQQYKVCIKSKVERSRERSSTLPYISV